MLNELKNNRLINKLIELNIKPILVGGMIRDYLINPKIISKDIDIELYTNKNYEEIVSLLELNNFKCNLVGNSFGVIKVSLDGEEIDLSLPRIEKSIGDKHKEFEIIPDGTLSFKEAFKRRDFTFNAIGYDIQNNSFIDLYGGVNDISNRMILHVDDKTFIEDPLRVYRAIQLASRLEFDIHSSTKKLMKSMIKNGMLDALPQERVFMEFEKLLIKSKKPSIGFELMRELGIIKKYFPELHSLIGVEQDLKWHPEGDVWIHTMMVIDEMAKIENSEKKLLYMYSCLCHDLGKPFCTNKDENGKITSIQHEKLGIEPTISFLKRLTNNKKLIEQTTKLVEFHLLPSMFFQTNVKNSTIVKLNNKLIDSGLELIDLLLINKSDTLGRTTLDALNGQAPQYDWFVGKMKELKVINEKVKPLINGEILIKTFNMKPGVEFKQLLKDAYDYQIENEVIEEKVMLLYIDKIINNEMSFNS